MSNASDGDPHHFSLKGKSAEDAAYSLATQSFLLDWCFLNPKLSDGKELCDLLVIFGDAALIWQIKDLKLGKDGKYNRSELEKNLRQLSGARRMLLDAKASITLSNARRSIENLDPTAIKQVFLFSLLMGEGEDYYSTIEYIKGLTVHVVTKSFLEIVLRELDTVADFCAYYAERERLLGLDTVPSLIVNGGEEELLGWYIQHGRSFSEFEGKNAVFLDGGIWEQLRNNPRYIARQQADEISYGWDAMINTAHTGDLPEYEEIARELARPNRFTRRMLAASFYEAAVAAHNDTIYDVFRRVLHLEGKTYCFLFASEQMAREHRRAVLGTFCYVARGRFKECDTVIGIATEKGIRPTCSYDFCLVHLPEWGAEQDREMKRIQSETGILTSPDLHHTQADEFPTVE